MSNRNINISKGTDTKDNTVYRDYNETIDTWSTAKSIVLVIGVITGAWLVIYILTRINCALDKVYDCTAATYVLWAYPALFVAALIIVLIAAIPLIKQWIENSAYLHMRGARIHREDLRKYGTQVFDVLKTSAHSEGSAGIDNYSPTLTGGKSDSKSDDEDNELDVNAIAWDEIFKRK